MFFKLYSTNCIFLWKAASNKVPEDMILNGFLLNRLLCIVTLKFIPCLFYARGIYIPVFSGLTQKQNSCKIGHVQGLD